MIGTENVFIWKQREMTERMVPLLLGSIGVTDIFKLKMKIFRDWASLYPITL